MCVFYMTKLPPLCSVNELRKELFCKKAKTMESIPPTQVYVNTQLAMYGIWYLFVCSVLFYNM